MIRHASRIPEPVALDMLSGQCGCRALEGRWVALCPTHRGEFDSVHRRWHEEHDALYWGQRKATS